MSASEQKLETPKKVGGGSRGEKRRQLEAQLAQLQENMVNSENQEHKARSPDKKALARREKELKEASAAIEKERREQERLRAQTDRMEEEKEALEQNYGSLKDEAAGKSKKLKKLTKKYKEKKEEMNDLQHEWQREKEGYLENLRDIHRQTALFKQITAVFLNSHDVERLTRKSRYDEDNDTWLLPDMEIPLFSPQIGTAPAPEGEGSRGGSRRRGRNSSLNRPPEEKPKQMTAQEKRQMQREMKATMEKDTALLSKTPAAFGISRRPMNSKDVMGELGLGKDLGGESSFSMPSSMSKPRQRGPPSGF